MTTRVMFVCPSTGSDVSVEIGDVTVIVDLTGTEPSYEVEWFHFPCGGPADAHRRFVGEHVARLLVASDADLSSPWR